MPTMAELIDAARAEREALGQVLFASSAFQRKLTRALATITVALGRAKTPVIAYTSGKDSMAVLALVQRLAPATPAAWSDDELEYPETVAHMALLRQVAGDQLIMTSGASQHAGWFWPWRDKPSFREPLPGMRRIKAEQDDYLRTKGFDLTFLGLREEESQVRREWLRQARLEHGLPLYPVKSGTGWRCCPIADWSADEVHALLVGWGLPINPVYDRLTAIGIPRAKQRVGPLPLVPRHYLADGWPDMLERLESRYGQRWHDHGRWG